MNRCIFINITSKVKIITYMVYMVVAQTVKNLPAMQDTWVPTLGREEILEKGMATHSTILARRIPWTV